MWGVRFGVDLIKLQLKIKSVVALTGNKHDAYYTRNLASKGSILKKLLCGEE